MRIMNTIQQSHTLRPLVVTLVHITEPQEHMIYLPYTAALLEAYVKGCATHPEHFQFTLPVFERLPLEENLKKLASADVVGLCCYLWNHEYTLALGQLLKQISPQCTLIAGGPMIPQNAENYLKQYPFIDVCVHGEGEAAFLSLLEGLPQKSWERIPGASFFNASGYHSTAPAPRRLNLDELPSPFLSGCFEPIMQAHPDKHWISVWESNRGCPFSCSFCDWGSATASKVTRFGMERLKAEMEWFGQNKIEIVFSSDANFGMLKRDVEIAQYMVDVKQRYQMPKKLYTQVTKNRADRAFTAQKVLKDGGLCLPVTLSLQSVDSQVLSAIQRDNISLDTYKDLQLRFRRAGMPTYTDLLVGLPDDNFERFSGNLAQVMDQGQHDELRCYNVFILPNAPMNSPEYRKQYAIETVTIPYITWYSEISRSQFDVLEKAEVIVATRSMSRQEWVRMRTLAWMSNILFYSTALKIPMILLNQHAGISFKYLLGAFHEAPLPEGATIIQMLRDFLNGRAQAILQGEADCIQGEEIREGVEGKKIWMPNDFYAFSQLVQPNALGANFFYEAEMVFQALLTEHAIQLPAGLLHEAMRLSTLLLYALRGGPKYFEIDSRFNLWEYYQHALRGDKIQLQQGFWRLRREPKGLGEHEMIRVAV